MTAIQTKVNLKIGELKGTLRLHNNCFFVDHYGTMLPVHIPQLKKLWGTFDNEKIQINQFVRFKKEIHNGINCAILTNVEDFKPNALVFEDYYVESLATFLSTSQFLLNLIDKWNINNVWASSYFKNLMTLVCGELEKVASTPFRISSKYDVDSSKVAEQHFDAADLIERNMIVAHKLSKLPQQEQVRFMALHENLLSQFDLL